MRRPDAQPLMSIEESGSKEGRSNLRGWDGKLALTLIDMSELPKGGVAFLGRYVSSRRRAHASQTFLPGPCNATPY